MRNSCPFLGLTEELLRDLEQQMPREKRPHPDLRRLRGLTLLCADLVSGACLNWRDGLSYWFMLRSEWLDWVQLGHTDRKRLQWLTVNLLEQAQAHD